MRRIFALLILCGASSAFGQPAQVAIEQAKQASEAAEAARHAVTKVITLKNASNVSTAVLEGIGLTVKRAGDIVVITGPQDRVDTAEAILKQLDVPPAPRPPVPPRKNIQLTAYLIIASPAGSQSTSLPKDLESAVSQVASVFPYKAFNLLDAIVMRVTDGSGGTVEGILPQVQQTFPSGGIYSLGISGISIMPPSDVMRLNSFDLGVSIARGTDKEGKDKYQTVKLSTKFLEIDEGKKVVVGKANIDSSSNALIVILTAKVID